MYPSAKDGTLTIKGSEVPVETTAIDNGGTGAFRAPFGGPESTTVTQIAATSSAAGVSGSSLVPSFYAQNHSYILSGRMEGKMAWWGKALCGIAAGLVAAALSYWCIYRSKRKGEDYGDIPIPDSYYGNAGVCCTKNNYFAETIASACCCIVVGALVGIFVSFGSILIPVSYGKGVEYMYENTMFDELSICSQWPNPCGTRDARFGDGIGVDDPAVVINVGHYLQKNGVNKNETLKLIVTNTNEKKNWDGEANIGKILQYFDTDFNKGVPPGGFLWNPGLSAPYRSPQIFEGYLDKDGLNDALVNITNSNMTTATFQATTIDNPSFGVSAGQAVEILLLNLNADITTIIVGRSRVVEQTQPLADMTNHIAFNKDLLERVRSFVYSDDESAEGAD